MNDLFAKPFPIAFTQTVNPKITITTGDVEKKLTPKKEINNQPSFTDIVYLQLELISQLSDSLSGTKQGFNFVSLFTGSDFSKYTSWLAKFGKYSTKEEFIDAMSGAITLKDMGVAQDVINGLYKCANEDKCSKVITFQKDPLDKYQTYTLSQIEKQLYADTGSILNQAILYYDNLKNTCNQTNINKIQDDFLKAQTQYICEDLLKSNLGDDATDYDYDKLDLGYSLGIRIKNLENIKNGINSASGTNLLGIYNIYWELTHLTIGTDKLSAIKEAVSTNDVNKQYKIISLIPQKDIKLLGKGKIAVQDKAKKFKAMFNTVKKLFTDNTWKKVAKEKWLNKRKNEKINLYNPGVYTINEADPNAEVVNIGGETLNMECDFEDKNGDCVPNYAGDDYKIIGYASYDDNYNMKKVDGSTYKVYTGGNVKIENGALYVGTSGYVMYGGEEQEYRLYNQQYNFAIEMKVRGEDLLRDGEHYLLSQPYGNKMFLKVIGKKNPAGGYNYILKLGYTDGSEEKYINIDLNKNIIKTNNSYIILAIFSGKYWKLELKLLDSNSNGKVIVEKYKEDMIKISPRRLYIGSKVFDCIADEKDCSSKSQNPRNGLIDYVKLYLSQYSY